MSQNLYIESIAEARQLREIAEANARNRIIDAITPQIKKLIEKKLLLDDGDEIDSDEGDAEILQGDNSPEDVYDDLPARPDSDLESSVDTQGPSVDVDEKGVNVSLGDVKVTVNLKESSLIGSAGNAQASIAQKASMLEKKYRFYKIMVESVKSKGIRNSASKKIEQILETLRRQAINLKSDAILSERDLKVIGKLDNLIKEMTMSRKHNDNVFDFLFETGLIEADESPAPEDEEEMPEEDEEEDDEGEGAEGKEGEDEEGTPDSVDLGELEPDVANALAALVKAIGGAGDLNDSYRADGRHNMADGRHGMADGRHSTKDPNEMSSMRHEEGQEIKLEMFNVNENDLRRELRRLRRLSEATSGVEDPEFTARAFGGGSVEDEMFIDVDEETLLNVLADEIGRVKFKGGKMHESTTARNHISPRAINENADLRSQLNNYKQVAESLKTQLVEMNVFNAKLLYANKLMQNKNLTQKQQRAIVEALDNAKTLREAKLLFQSLTASLNKEKTRSLHEGSSLRTLGSASRSTQSAQVRPTSSGVEVDRWAVLAGIAGKK